MSTEKLLRKSPRLCNVNVTPGDCGGERQASKKLKIAGSAMQNKGKGKGKAVSFLVGDPVPDEEARQRWPWRYEEKVRSFFSLLFFFFWAFMGLFDRRENVGKGWERKG